MILFAIVMKMLSLANGEQGYNALGYDNFFPPNAFLRRRRKKALLRVNDRGGGWRMCILGLCRVYVHTCARARQARLQLTFVAMAILTGLESLSRFWSVSPGLMSFREKALVSTEKLANSSEVQSEPHLPSDVVLGQLVTERIGLEKCIVLSFSS